MFLLTALPDDATSSSKIISWIAMEDKPKGVPSPSKGLLQSEELYEYILETSVYPREPEPLKELRALTACHPRAIMGTAPDAGQMMALLLKLVNAKRTIEVGVFTGYSLLLTALTIPDDGKIVAIDMNRDTYEIGLPIIKKAGVEHKINFVESEALPVLDKLVEDHDNEGSFDYAFVDADKINYLNYHQRLLKLVKVGGLVVYDNTLWGGSVAMPEEHVTEQTRAVRHFTVGLNKSLAADPRIQISHAPLGDVDVETSNHAPFTGEERYLWAVEIRWCFFSLSLSLSLSLLCKSSYQTVGLQRKTNQREHPVEAKGYYRVKSCISISLRQVCTLESQSLSRISGLLLLATRGDCSFPLPFKEDNRPFFPISGAIMGTAPDAGQMMAVLLKLVNAKGTIEVGVFTGYSLLLTALTIPDDGKHDNEGSFDHVFVDADKINYLNYHERLLKLVKVGGLVVYDSTLWTGSVVLPEEHVAERMRADRHCVIELNNSLAADPRIQISQAPLGDGDGDVIPENPKRILVDFQTYQSRVARTIARLIGIAIPTCAFNLVQYILETSVYPREPEPLKELRAVTACHPRAIMGTAPDAGQMMALLLKLVNAKRTIEVGVFTGYSLLLTALTIPDDGKIVAIDMNRDTYEIGLPIIKKAGVEHKINFVESEALPVLDKLLEDHDNERSFDYAFVDADKINYLNYHERLLKLVKVGGLVVYDNTLSAGSVVMPEEHVAEWMRAVRHCIIELNNSLAADPRIQISHAPLGDGITICRRIY
ncbi:hypothetical protein RJ639_042389 [Escallonia herrerae]|uniref:Caffeoyl-CoA O-methyltransferase n=1 Tax=Escallonia herrerae TaxID=1293975 RepID=A0AA88WT62_9ASTE|nr:hypothetical protein RJ639_042389 [Escallonia herrerae]